MADDSHAARWLIAAFVAVMSSFIAATGFSQLEAKEIGSLADSLSNNAMPSIERLASARTELRHVEALAVRYGSGDAPTRASLMKAMMLAERRIDDDVDAYLRLPVYPGERDLWREIRRALDAVDAAVATTHAYLLAGDEVRGVASIAALESACDEASQAVLTDIEFNANNGAELGRRIERLRVRSRTVAFALDAISVLLTLIVGVLAVRAVSKHAALLRRHNELLSERAAELELFAGRVAHDVLNPISAARLSLAFVQKHSGLQPNVEEIAAHGLSSLQRATRYVDGLLEFARAGAHPTEGSRSKVRPVIESLVDDLQISATEAGVSLECGELPDVEVMCDRSILEVVVANLVRNAIKYIGDGAAKEIVVRGLDRGATVRVEVSDTGPGVAPELRKPIFEPFVRGPTAGQRGVGLGLATVKRICTSHGGTVGVDARPGGGSIFWFELPRAST